MQRDAWWGDLQEPGYGGEAGQVFGRHVAVACDPREAGPA